LFGILLLIKYCNKSERLYLLFMSYCAICDDNHLSSTSFSLQLYIWKEWRRIWRKE
jgi:hypothetical protein